ncbi:MAG: AsmA family protein [Betaproteobacteria bacterium]|nr:AsmA family protein [Betaproteobacteria bacterium]
MTQRSTKLRYWKWGVVPAVVAALAVAVIFFPWNWLRGPIGGLVTEKTGRTFVIAGDLDVKLGLTPRIRMRDVRFDNSEWAHDTRMITAKEADFTIDLRELWRGRLVFPDVRLSEPSVSLERARDGQRNWILKETDDGTAAAPEIRQLAIDQGVIRLRDFIIGADVKVDVTMRDDPTNERPTLIAFSGKYQNVVLEGKAQAGPVLSLQNTSAPFSMWVRARMGETVIEADGTFTDIARFGTVDTRLRIRGPDWSQLYPVIPLPLPTSPPYSFDGRFKRDGDQYAYENFTGRIGSSDISGNATYVYREPRPFLKARLASRMLDLNDLGPIIGAKANGSAPPSNNSAEAPPAPEAATPAGRSAANGKRVLPDDPFKLDRLNAIDANVTLKARQFRRPDALPLENIVAQLALEGGMLKLAPLNFGFAGGEIKSSVSINARQDPINTDATINLRKARVDQLFPTIKLMKDSAGQVGAHVRLKGRGNSIATMLSGASGELGIAVSGGELSNLLVEVVGLDGGEIIKFLAGGDQKTAIRCGVASFKVNDGVAQSEVLVFDTDDTNIGGSGSIDLRDETLNLRLSPRPKDASILSIRSPIYLWGPFSEPSVSLDKGRLATRAGAAVLLGLINPLAALIPLIETGPGKDANCAELLQLVEKARIEAGVKKE